MIVSGHSPGGIARCAVCHVVARNAAFNAEKGYTAGRPECIQTNQSLLIFVGAPELYYMGHITSE